MVGGTMPSRMASAQTAITAWIGATLRPWPKAMVMVLRSDQCLGTSGSALSGNSVRNRSSWPIFLRKVLWPSTPTISASRAAPMFDEWVNTSGTDSTRWVA